MNSYELIIRNGDREGEAIPIQFGVSLVGRSRNANVSFPEDKKISSRHCSIVFNEQGCSIEDLSSRNGTFLNGQRIAAIELLSPGDRIGIGSTLLEFFSVSEATKSSLEVTPSLDVKPIVDIDYQDEKESPAPLSTTKNSESPQELEQDDVIQCRLRPHARGDASKLCIISLDQSIEVGRSAQCDYSFPDDSTMSGRHFRVSLKRDGCFLQDLESKHGTWVNGTRVDRCALFDGVEIKAGAKIFSVEIHGIECVVPTADPAFASEIVARAKMDSQAKGTAREKVLAKAKELVSRTDLCHEFMRLQGMWESEPAPIAWIEQLLAKSGEVYLLLDSSRFELDATGPEPEESDQLFDWLEPDVAITTPRLIALRSWNGWKSAVEEAWGSDAMMVLTSQRPQEELVIHLRRLLRGTATAGTSPHAIQGVCWPSVLRSLLEVEFKGFAKQYFENIDSVWMEDGDDPLAWDWLGKPAVLEPLCKSIGLQFSQPEETKTKG
jgi:pSer/pThr/pTyr-binding forkhead associated (FHA) protein